ncbi:lipase 3-like [Coccinella septempunctata]|uniref:lipase 3-like n=1 Tax=Coccinella septempunctata TaxID=41139 RepID=UPI001D08C713|nr:lipase 3-like [Coccinella septempunctata]
MAEFIMEKQQLGYFLTDSGFDVWIANCRGTTYSRKHRSYAENSNDYWNYSFHEIGYYDIPKFIDLILDETTYSKLHYIGVSQGCTVLSVLLSTRTEYNEKIKVACFLCPAMKFKYTKLSLMKIFFFYISPFLKWTNDYLRLPLHGDIICYLMRVIGLESSKYRLADYIYQLLWTYYGGHLAGKSIRSVDLHKVCRTSPNTVSLKQVTHFSQIIRENTFRMFDYGPEKNFEKYNSRTPPNYDLSKVSVPIGLFYSRNDTCYGLQDMEDLSKELGNCVHQYIVEDDKFNHFDFVYHKEAVDLLYVKILDFMKKYLPDPFPTS